jgi:hypothetical protein
MKALILMILVPIAGCATLGSTPGTQVASGSRAAATGIDFAPAPSAPPFSDQNMGPRLIMPVTGGAPVFGIPFGGNMYLPVTGGTPVVGMPLTP